MVITIRNKTLLKLLWPRPEGYPESVTASHKLWWQWAKRWFE